MTCHEAAAALVDDRAPRPPGLEAHLQQCAECRAVAALHDSASALRLREPPVPAPVPREAVLREVRFRVLRRRVSLGAVASFAVAALVLWSRPQAPGPGLAPEVEEATPRFAESAPLYASEVDVAPVASAPEEYVLQEEPSALARLIHEVRGYTRREVTTGDELYRPFGQLAAWVRPPDMTALDAEPFRNALYPLHPTEALR